MLVHVIPTTSSIFVSVYLRSKAIRKNASLGFKRKMKLFLFHLPSDPAGRQLVRRGDGGQRKQHPPPAAGQLHRQGQIPHRRARGPGDPAGPAAHGNPAAGVWHAPGPGNLPRPHAGDALSGQCGVRIRPCLVVQGGCGLAQQVQGSLGRGQTVFISSRKKKICFYFC